MCGDSKSQGISVNKMARRRDHLFWGLFWDLLRYLRTPAGTHHTHSWHPLPQHSFSPGSTGSIVLRGPVSWTGSRSSRRNGDPSPKSRRRPATPGSPPRSSAFSAPKHALGFRRTNFCRYRIRIIRLRAAAARFAGRSAAKRADRPKMCLAAVRHVVDRR